MLTDLFIYLVQNTVSLAIFALAYRFFFSHLTHFHWNRFYLLVCVLISVLIPFWPKTGWFDSAVSPELLFRFNPVLFGWESTTTHSALETTQALVDLRWTGFIVLGLYFAGFLYKSWRLYRNLNAVFRLFRRYQKVEENPVYSVYFQSDLPTFSFWRSIFLSEDDDLLTPKEQAQVLLHEEIHVRHWHTLDLLFFEFAGIVFWFNPIVKYLQFSIRQVHEYTVDAIVARTIGNVRQYGYLLLKLSSRTALPLLATFSNKQVFRRIQMLTQKPSSAMQKLKFLIVFPLLGLVVFLYSCFGDKEQPGAQTDLSKPAVGIPIGQISWKGNTVFSAEQLNKTFGMQPGDLYEKKAFADRLTNRAGMDVNSLYMDNGYLLFNAAVIEKRVGEGINLEMQVFEGKPFRTGAVTFRGNQKVSAEQLTQLISIRSGELFNRSKLIQSQLALAESGYFKPGTIGINPVPDSEHNTVDLMFILVENP